MEDRDNFTNFKEFFQLHNQMFAFQFCVQNSELKIFGFKFNDFIWDKVKIQTKTQLGIFKSFFLKNDCHSEN